MGWLRNLHRRISPATPLEIVQASIAAINSRDWGELAEILAEDFRFEEGEYRIEGRDAYLAAIKAMVADAADFQLLVDDYEVNGNQVTARGSSHATSHRFRTAAVWRLGVVQGKVAHLRSFRASNHARLASYALGSTKPDGTEGKA